MDCARNIITANFSGGGTSATTAPLWQWDYGQVLCITGIDLPAAFEVHFSTNRAGGVSTTAVGADGQVTIPNVLLTIGKNLNAWIYLSDSEGEGETEYSILIPVKARPMPETYDAEVSGEFDDVVRQVSEYAETAQTAADNAGASASAAAASADNAAASASAAETAKTAAETAQGEAEDAQAAAETAAQTATDKASQTAQDAAQAAQSKADAESAAGRAEAAQTGAESAKADAETAAQSAADSASAASTSATSAGQAASAAAQSATAAAQSAASIEGDVQIASQKASEAQTAAGQAVTAKDAAVTAQQGAEGPVTIGGQSASTAITKAAEAATSASGAAQSKTDAEAAAARAEQAAATLTVDTALSDTSTNPVQNKVITAELTNVKSALSENTRNLLHLKETTKTVNGVTITTHPNGTVDFSGTGTSNGGRGQWFGDTTRLSAGTYCMTVYVDDANAPRPFPVLNTMSSPGIMVVEGSVNGASFTLTEETEVRVGFNIANGTSYNGTLKIQVESGTSKTEYIPPITATDFVARQEMNALSAVVSVHSDMLYIYKECTFEQGTIRSNGAEADNPNRIRTQEYISTAEFFSASVDANHRIWYAEYNADKTFRTIKTSGVVKVLKSDLSADSHFVRFVVVNSSFETPITPSADTGFELKVNAIMAIPGDVYNELNARIDEVSDSLQVNRYYPSFPRYDFILDAVSIYSDATVVGTKYVGFSSGSDDLETQGRIAIYDFPNGFENACAGAKTLYHKFGHCNTVDYNPATDCLIMGNGSGAYNLPGKIYIIPAFSTILNRAENELVTLENSNAIVIDCTTYNLGTKFNVIWGEQNGNSNNIAYLITAKYGSSTSAPDAADNGTIRKLLLGMGSNALTYGSIVSADADEFNGTFDIIDTFTQTGTSYAQCNQGSCFYDGKIYACIGHDGKWLWKMWLDDHNKAIHYDQYKQHTYDGTGQIIDTTVNASSVCVSDKYLFMGCVNIGVMAFKLF